MKIPVVVRKAAETATAAKYGLLREEQQHGSDGKFTSGGGGSSKAKGPQDKGTDFGGKVGTVSPAAWRKAGGTFGAVHRQPRPDELKKNTFGQPHRQLRPDELKPATFGRPRIAGQTEGATDKKKGKKPS